MGKNLNSRNPRSSVFSGLFLYLANEVGEWKVLATDLFAELGGGTKSVYTLGVGGDYETIELALAENRYNLRQISDYTETVGWGISPNRIVHIDSQGYTINVAINLDNANNAGNFYFTDVKFNVTGLIAIFYGTQIHLKGNCEINGGDANFNMFSNNITIPNIITAQNLTINGGASGDIRVGIFQVSNKLQIINSNASDGISIFGAGGFVNYLKMDSTSRIDIFGDTVIRAGHGGTGVIYARGVRATIINMKSFTLYNRLNGARVFNCNITVLISYTNTIGLFEILKDCLVASMPTSGIGSVADRLYLKNGGVIDNVSFSNGDVEITGANQTVNNSKATLGTFAVSATANEAKLMGNETLNSITNLGTNTTGSTGTEGNTLI